MHQKEESGKISINQTVVDCLADFVAIGTGKYARAIKRSDDKMKVLNNILDRAKRVASGNNPRASRVQRVIKAQNDVNNYGNKAEQKTKSTIELIENSAVKYDKKRVEED